VAQVGRGQVELVPPQPRSFDEPFNFACQGCGAFCCTNERLVLSPLELRRLVLAVGIDAADLSKAGWLGARPDPVTGIPQVAVEFVSVHTGLTACPFLANGIAGGQLPPLAGASADRLNELSQRQRSTRAALHEHAGSDGRFLPLQCGAYDGRPLMCRAFPLQVKILLRANGEAFDWTTLAHTRCPGHGLGRGSQSVGDYLTVSGVEPLSRARIDWHQLNLAIATAGVALQDHDAASGSRRALWNATLNLLFAGYARPRLQVPEVDYVSTLHALFEQYLAPVARYMDVEGEVERGALDRQAAASGLRRLVASCQSLEAALDQRPPGPAEHLRWPEAVR